MLGGAGMQGGVGARTSRTASEGLLKRSNGPRSGSLGPLCPEAAWQRGDLPGSTREGRGERRLHQQSSPFLVVCHGKYSVFDLASTLLPSYSPVNVIATHRVP